MLQEASASFYKNWAKSVDSSSQSLAASLFLKVGGNGGRGQHLKKEAQIRTGNQTLKSSQATSPFGSQETLVQPPSSTSTTTSCRGKLERSGTDDEDVRGDGAFTDFSCNEDESDTDWQAKVSRKLCWDTFYKNPPQDQSSKCPFQTPSRIFHQVRLSKDSLGIYI